MSKKGWRMYRFFVPKDAVPEVSQVLHALMREGGTTNMTAAFLYLIRSHKAEILATAESLARQRGA